MIDSGFFFMNYITVDYTVLSEYQKIHRHHNINKHIQIHADTHIHVHKTHMLSREGATSESQVQREGIDLLLSA